MRKLTKALLVLLGLVIPTNPAVIESGQGTLFVFGATNTAIVVAADGRTSDRGRPTGARSKLIQFGDSGVCFIGGYSIVAQYPDSVDFQKKVADWIKLNPQVSLPDAKTAMDKAIVDSMKAFQRRNPKWKPDHNDPFSYFVCAGYLLGLPSYYATQFVIAPGGNVNNTNSSGQMMPGLLQTQGWGNVCDEIIHGSSMKFDGLKRDPVALAYRKAFAVRSFAAISTQDLLRMSQICLEATESADGTSFDPNAVLVGRPNSYVIIDRQGFRWVDPPASPGPAQTRKIAPKN